MIEDGTELFGEWWVPGAVTHKALGTLDLLASPLPRLRAVGRIPREDGRLPMVLLGEAIGGERVTLLSSHFVRHPISDGDRASHYEVVSPRVFVGAHFNSPDEVRFRSVAVEVPGFLQWFAPGLSLEAEDDGTTTRLVVSLRGDRPPTVEVPCRGGRMSFLREGPFAAQWMLGGTQQATVKQLVGVKFDFLEDRPETDFWEQIADLQSFLAFWWGAPVYYHNVWAQGEAGLTAMAARDVANAWVRIHDSASRSAKDTDTGRYLFGALLSFAEIGGHFPALWERWQVVAERYRSVLDLYLSASYGESNQYATDHFLSLVQALEIFHRIKFPGTHMEAELFRTTILPELRRALDACPDPKFATIAAQRLGNLNALDLRSRIEALVQVHKPVVWLRVGQSGFAADVVNTRNYLTHRTPSMRAKAASGAALGHLAFRCRFLLEILLLSELGYTEDELERFVLRHIVHGRWTYLHRHRWG